MFILLPAYTKVSSCQAVRKLHNYICNLSRNGHLDALNHVNQLCIVID
jgi:hypothetical protein